MRKLFSIPRQRLGSAFTPAPIGDLATARIQLVRGFTLIEALLTVAILGLVLTAMVPFVQILYRSLNIGDQQAVLLGNGRAGLDIVTQALRQAKRIIAIPSSGSGDFVSFRDGLDTKTVTFYHNIKGSLFYIGNKGLIKDGDLVMRVQDASGMTDALLARYVTGFKMLFKDSLGALTTKPYLASSVDTTLILTDPEDKSKRTLELFSRDYVRCEVRLDKPVWVAAGDSVFELLTDKQLTGFAKAQSVSLDENTGELWVADTGNNRIKKISPEGKILLDLTGFNSPYSVSVNATTGECWVADTGNSRIKKLSPSGALLANISGFSSPYSVSVNPATGDVWVANTNSNRVVKIPSAGGEIIVTGFKRPNGVAVNPNDGSCWVADTNNNRIKRVSSAGTVVLNRSGFNRPKAVSVNISDGSCWVADTNGNRIRKLSSGGTLLFTVTGFVLPNSVSVSPADGSCWVADTGNNQVIGLDSEGAEEFRIGGFSAPASVAGFPK